MTATGRPGDDGLAQLALDGIEPPVGASTAPSAHRGALGAPSVPKATGPAATGLGVLLAQLGASSSQRFATSVAALGLGPADAAVLRLVAYAPGLSQREIADRLGLQPSRLVSLVDSLEARGLVERTRSHLDRRNYELRLAPGGMAVYEDLARVIGLHDEEMCGRLGADERAQLLSLLARVAADAGLASGSELSYRLP